MINHN